MPSVHPEDKSLPGSVPPSLEGGILLQIQAPNYPPKKVYIRSPRCSIGSSRDCTLRLVAEGVEPLHCLLIRSGSEVAVQRAARSTWLNGQEFHSAPFRAGDHLRLGPIVIQLLRIGEESPKTSSSPSSPATVRTPSQERMDSGGLLEPAGADGSPGLLSDGVQSSKRKGKQDSSAAEQTIRRLGHQRARRLIGLVRQAREKIEQLQKQVEQLRTDFETLRSEEVRLRTLAQQHAVWETQSRQLAELETRLHHRQHDLDRREARLETQRQTSERQWAEWKAEQEQLQQELQRQAQTLQQQQAELLESQKILEKRLQELQTQQQSFQQFQIEQQQALQAQKEALAQKEQELAQWQHRLEVDQQTLAEQQASLTDQQQALQDQREYLQALQQRLPEDSPQEISPPEAPVPEERIERYTRPPEPRTDSHAEEILRRLGMMPHFEQEEEGGSDSAAESATGRSEQTVSSRSGVSTSETSPSDEESVVHAYMERLLGRGWKQATQSSPAEEVPEEDASGSARSGTRDTRADAEAKGNLSRSGPPRRRATAEWTPRSAPERGVDLEAMRDLANLSAHRALEHHHRRKAIAAVWAKFLVSAFSLILGSGMLWVWGGKPEHALALYGAAACFLVAALWGIQYLVLAGKLILRSFGARNSAESRRDASLASENPPFPAADAAPTFGPSVPYEAAWPKTPPPGIEGKASSSSLASGEVVSGGKGEGEVKDSPPETETPPSGV